MPFENIEDVSSDNLEACDCILRGYMKMVVEIPVDLENVVDRAL